MLAYELQANKMLRLDWRERRGPIVCLYPEVYIPQDTNIYGHLNLPTNGSKLAIFR
jgi:hypothetical protein